MTKAAFLRKWVPVIPEDKLTDFLDAVAAALGLLISIMSYIVGQVDK